jgi:hypothetical protein
MRSTKGCRTETLLNGSSCDLQYCPDCKMVHLALGSITLHLSKVHFQELVNELGKGMFNLKYRDESLDDRVNNSMSILHS